jgi:phage tail-like protein
MALATITPGSRQDQATDYYHSFRFGVIDSVGYIQNQLVAGFSGCTLPERNIDHIEYSEGTWTYSKMYPGRSTFTTVTLSKGVVKGYTAFADWIVACSEGKDYRTDITIMLYHRKDLEGKSSGPEFVVSQLPSSRKIVCFNCVPIRFRPGHDYDPLASDISVQEIEFQPEYFKVVQGEPGIDVPTT